MELTFEQWLESNPTAKRDYDMYAADPLTQARFKLFWLQGGTNAARQITKNVTN